MMIELIDNVEMEHPHMQALVKASEHLARAIDALEDK